MTTPTTPPPPPEVIESYRLPEELLEQAMTPALIVFPENVRHNIRAVLDGCGGDPNRWRPHLKTTKSPAIWHELIEAGIRQFKCATTREASYLLELLDDCEITDGDLLIAYSLIGPGLRRAAHLAEAHPNTAVSVLCENAGLAALVPADLGIFVDVNPQMNRTGIPLDQIERITGIAQAAGSRFRGVHFYDGHVRDDDPGMRRSRADALYGQLLEIRVALIEAGCHVNELITSGTMTFEAALGFEPFGALDDTIHRISPGTVVFSDVMTEQANLTTDLRPAALLMTRVISHPADDVITCDAGSKSIAAEAGHPCARVLDEPHLVPRIPSEEHLPIQVEPGGGSLPALGDVLLLVPKHICPTVNLAEHAVLVEDGEIAGIIDIAARGHELLAPESE